MRHTKAILAYPFNAGPRISRRVALQIGAASMLAAFTGCRTIPAGVSAEPTDLHRASATDLARLLRQRKVSATELCRSTIARIERLDAQVNAVVVRDFERALSDAKSADAALARGVNLPLLGIPMTVKESFDLQGHPTTAGLRERLSNIAQRDAEVVRRAKGRRSTRARQDQCSGAPARPPELQSDLWPHRQSLLALAFAGRIVRRFSGCHRNGVFGLGNRLGLRGIDPGSGGLLRCLWAQDELRHGVLDRARL